MQKKIVVPEGHDQHHQFSFYSQSFFALSRQVETVIAIQDEELIHRVVRVVKLKIKEKFVIFDQKHHALVELVACLKSELKLLLLSLQENGELTPHVTFLLPVLKKEALEDAIYSLAELGVNAIQLVVTEKSRKEIVQKDMIRLQKMIIAGAEQSKHYTFPVLMPIKQFEECLHDLPLDSAKVAFDISGEPFFKVYQELSVETVCLFIGPEGGLTVQELSQLKEHDFKISSLTPTILRALQAAAVGAALFRVL